MDIMNRESIRSPFKMLLFFPEEIKNTKKKKIPSVLTSIAFKKRIEKEKRSKKKKKLHMHARKRIKQK